MQSSYRNRPTPPPPLAGRPRARSASRPRRDELDRDNNYDRTKDYDSYKDTPGSRGGTRPTLAITNSNATRPTDPSNQYPSEGRQTHLRQQRSLAFLASQNLSSASRAFLNSTSDPAMPPPPSRVYNQPNSSVSSMSSWRTPSLASSGTTASTASSSSSSFMERMKISSAGGYSSTSRTSFETDSGSASPQDTQSRGRQWDNRKQYADTDGRQQPEIAEADGTDGYSGYGYAVWNRIATAASSLTVNVDLSWASNIISQSGEETPPGSESRLTRAMKAYHLEKAKTRSDLPPWLFDESERRGASLTNVSGNGEERDEWGRVVEKRGRGGERDRERYEDDEDEGRGKGGRGRGLRDVYENAAASDDHDRDDRRDGRRSMSMRRGGANEYGGGEVGGGSKAADRLKAIREAKRQALGVGRERERERAREGDRYEQERERENTRPTSTRERANNGSSDLRRRGSNNSQGGHARVQSVGPATRHNRDQDWERGGGGSSMTDYGREGGSRSRAPTLPRGPQQSQNQGRGLPPPPPIPPHAQPQHPYARSGAQSQSAGYVGGDLGYSNSLRGGESSMRMRSQSQSRAAGGGGGGGYAGVGAGGRGVTLPTEPFGGGGGGVRRVRR